MGLKYVETFIAQDIQATLTLTLSKEGPGDEQIRHTILQSHCTIKSWGLLSSITISAGKSAATSKGLLPRETRPPDFVEQFANNPHVLNIEW